MMVIEAAAKIRMDERFSCQLRNGILALDNVIVAGMMGQGEDNIRRSVEGFFSDSVGGG
jgi:hypothetical protein